MGPVVRNNVKRNINVMETCRLDQLQGVLHCVARGTEFRLNV